MPAVRKLLKRAKVKIEDIDTIELNEAFSSQVLTCQKELSISDDKLNRWVAQSLLVTHMEQVALL